MKKRLIKSALWLMGLMGTLAIWVVNAQEINKDIVIEATSTEANQTLKINKYFANAYTVDRWDWSPVQNLTSDTTHTYSIASGYIITLSLSWADRWRFEAHGFLYPLVSQYGTTVTWVKIVYMPSLSDGFGDSTTNPGDYFFSFFNYDWAITGLPEWSFDTSNITTAGSSFFDSFNCNWVITSLPVWSFDTSNIISAGDHFFSYFNSYWWRLTSLPDWSFRFSSWLTTVGDYFFVNFNMEWQLTSLPVWSFDTSNITTVWNEFFLGFNDNWQLTSLPDWSFDTSNITTVWDEFFLGFNDNWQLTSLPAWSFRFATWLTSVKSEFFMSFNNGWALTSLPEWSFDTSHITSVRGNFFRGFNSYWALESLPNWSFDTSNITTVGWWEWDEFLESSNFFLVFNYNGKITNLPDSFKLNSSWASVYRWYLGAFNSPEYTLNKKVSDLVSWVTVPLDDKDTFSDNQLWRCGVHENWLVNPASNCKTVTFETNSWSLVDSQIVDIDNNEKVIKPTDPTKTWNTFTGWYVDEDLTDNFDFSTVITGDTTLYAKWQVNQYTITVDIDGTLTAITWGYGSPVDKPANPTKNWYRFIGWEPEIPDTMPAEDMTVKAKWEKNWSSWWWGWWGGWWWSSSSSSTGSNTATGWDNSNNTWNQQTWSGVNSSTGTQNEQPTSWTKINEPEANTGSNIQTWNQVDSSEQTPQNDKQGTQDSSPSSQNDGKTYTPEFQQAYEFAKWHWITTMPTIQKADMDGKLTRIAMAKMLSQYAMNVLWKTPDTTQNNKFNDVTDKQNSDYDNGVTLAYQLWIMWQNMPWNNFRPDDEVTRAEFATALSRMLYHTSDWQYKSTDKYYTNHMKKLVQEKIITKEDPKMKELRWYVMIMLMRSAK